MKKEELKREWLANNAVVAFVGALIVAQSWVVSKGTIELLPNCTVTLPYWMFLSIWPILLVLSVLFAVASVMSSLGSWVFLKASSYTLYFASVNWMVLNVAWLLTIAELTGNHTLLYIFLVSGAVLSGFFLLSSPYRASQRRKSDDDDPYVMEERLLCAALFVGGFVLLVCILVLCVVSC